ncbi:hypothetical protein Tco_1275065 [Tanacetum coccineum]
MQEPGKPVKVKGKDQIEYDADVVQKWDSIEARIDVDAQLAKRLQAEEREQMSVEEQAKLLMEFIAARKKFFATKKAEEQRNKPPTKTEQRTKMYTESSGKKAESSGKKAERSRKKTVSKKRAGEKLDEKSVKRQKVGDDAEKAELKACLEIVPGDDSVVNIESLSTKYPILVEKKYPVTQEMLSRMLSRRLEVDHECEMAFELLRFTRSQLKKVQLATADEVEEKRNLLGLKVFLVLLKLLLLVMIVTATGYVSTAGEVQRKYSKSLLLLVLVTSVKEYYYLWFWVMNKIIDKLLKNNSLDAKRAGNSRGNLSLKSILNKTSYTPADNVVGVTINAGVIHKGVDIDGLNASGASATDEDK